MHSSVTSSGYSEGCHCVYFSSTNEHCKHAAGHEEEWKQQRDAENVSRYQCEEQVYDVVRYIYINIYTYTYICKMRTHTSENVQRTCCLLCRECVFATALLHCWMMTLWCIEECRSLNANPFVPLGKAEFVHPYPYRKRNAIRCEHRREVTNTSSRDKNHNLKHCK